MSGNTVTRRRSTRRAPPKGKKAASFSESQNPLFRFQLPSPLQPAPVSASSPFSRLPTPPPSTSSSRSGLHAASSASSLFQSRSRRRRSNNTRLSLSSSRPSSSLPPLSPHTRAMESPLVCLSPSPYGLTLFGDSPASPFSVREDEPSSYSFASFSGLAEQLCAPSKGHISISSAASSSSAKSPASTAFDDLVNDFFSSDDDFLSPSYSFSDLPSSPFHETPSSTPRLPSFTAGAAEMSKTASAMSGSSFNTAISFADLEHAWEEPTTPLDGVFLGYSPEQHWPDEDDYSLPSSSWAFSESLGVPVSTLHNKASFESMASWATNDDDDDDDTWASEPFFNSAPTWKSIIDSSPSTVIETAPTTPPPSAGAPARSYTPRTPHRARSTPQLQPPPIKQRQRLPAKTSMPALREEAADDSFGYIFDGGAALEPAPSQSMFAVLGGYGGESQSLAAEWESRTAGSDAYGGGGGSLGFYNTLERFETAQYRASLGGLGSPYHGHQNQLGSISYQTIAPRQLQYSHSDSPSPADITPPPSATLPHAVPASCESPRPQSAPATSSTFAHSLPRRASASTLSSKAVKTLRVRKSEDDLRREYRQQALERSCDAPSSPVSSILIQGWTPTPWSSPISSVVLSSPSSTRSVSPAKTLRKPSSMSRLAPLPDVKPVVHRIINDAPASSSSSSSSSASSPPKLNLTECDQGGFKWGSTQFINYSSKDADYLLTGVAPSGQGRRVASAVSSASSGAGKRKRSSDDEDDEVVTGGKRSKSRA